MNKMRVLSIIVTCICLNINAQQNTSKQNTLTEKEKQEGWLLLFDGKDLKGWHSYLQKKPGKAWQAQNGMIFLNKNKNSVSEDFGDLVTEEAV